MIVLERLLGPSLECAQLVYEELKRMIYNLEMSEMKRFHNLNCQITTILEKMLSNLMIPTCSMIKNIFEVELGHINTRHPDFVLATKDSLASNAKKEGSDQAANGRGNDSALKKDKKRSQGALEQARKEEDALSTITEDLNKSVRIKQKRKNLLEFVFKSTIVSSLRL